MNSRNGSSPPIQPVRVVILESDDDARRLLAKWLGTCDGVTVVAGHAGDADGRAALARHRPDVVFANLDLGGIDAIELLGTLPGTERPLAVILAATGAHALRAFEHDAVDYLVAPFGAPRLGAALERVRRRMVPPTPHALSPQPLDKLPVRVGRRILLLPLDDIRVLRARNLKTEIVGASIQHLANHPLGQLAAKLPPERFLRVHRSIVVNLDHVRQLRAKAHGDGALFLKDGTQVPYTRTHRRALVAALSGRNGRRAATG